MNDDEVTDPCRLELVTLYLRGPQRPSAEAAPSYYTLYMAKYATCVTVDEVPEYTISAEGVKVLESIRRPLVVRVNHAKAYGSKRERASAILALKRFDAGQRWRDK